ncbi:MAG: nucleotidyltransferase family protein [Actinomycetota bacterium]|nr:nucleotidyltransferase family protein [Actinomycetota bacterium]
MVIPPPNSEPPSPRLQSAGHILRLEVAIEEVIAALTQARIPTILLKGPSIARWLYESRADRPYGDGDILVAPHDHPKGETVLESLGFETERYTSIPGDRKPEASEWRRDDGIWMDLHFTIPGVRVSPDIAWSVLSTHVEKMDLRGHQVNVLSIPARTLHLVLHAAHHGAETSQPLRDLTKALEEVSGETWRQAHELAQQLDATEAFSAGLGLVPEGEELRARFGLLPPTDVDVALKSVSASAAALNLQTFATISGLRAKLRFVLGKLFPPPSFLRNRSALARRGRTGLILAYLSRPLVVFGRLGPGLMAWLRIRRAARRGRG